MLSPVRRLSVCNVRAPYTQAVQIFGNISTALGNSILEKRSWVLEKSWKFLEAREWEPCALHMVWYGMVGNTTERTLSSFHNLIALVVRACRQYNFSPTKS